MCSAIVVSDTLRAQWSTCICCVLCKLEISPTCDSSFVGGARLERALAGEREPSITFGAPTHTRTLKKSANLDPDDPDLLAAWGPSLAIHLKGCALLVSRTLHDP